LTLRVEEEEEVEEVEEKEVEQVELLEGDLIENRKKEDLEGVGDHKEVVASKVDDLKVDEEGDRTVMKVKKGFQLVK